MKNTEIVYSRNICDGVHFNITMADGLLLVYTEYDVHLLSSFDIIWIRISFLCAVRVNYKNNIYDGKNGMVWFLESFQTNN